MNLLTKKGLLIKNKRQSADHKLKPSECSFNLRHLYLRCLRSTFQALARPNDVFLK